MSLAELRTSAADTGAALADAAGALARLSPDAAAFPVAVPGRLGQLGDAMRAQLAGALAARAREAAAHAARFTDAAQVLGLVAAGYADTDAQARRRHQHEES